jgi:hypothetical protein
LRKGKVLIIVPFLFLLLVGVSFAGGMQTSSLSQSGAEAIAESFGYMQQGNWPTYLRQIIPGVVGDVTHSGDLPEFDGIKKLRTKTTIVDLRTNIEVPYDRFDKLVTSGIAVAVISPDKVIQTKVWRRGGRVIGFTRLEDLEKDIEGLIQSAVDAFAERDTTNIRLSVNMKMVSKTFGVNVNGMGQGGGFANTTNPLAYGFSGGSVTGIDVNKANPEFEIKFHKVFPGGIKIFNAQALKEIYIR